MNYNFKILNISQKYKLGNRLNRESLLDICMVMVQVMVNQVGNVFALKKTAVEFVTINTE